jgi:hypothetical protein
MKKAMAIILLLVGIVLAILAFIKYENYSSNASEAFSEAMPFALGSGALIILSIVLLILSRKKKAA